MVYIIKSKDVERPRQMVSRESLLSSRISNRSLEKEDIHFILNQGDACLKRQLDRKMNEINQETKHIHRMYGNDFDFRRNDGALVKPLGELDL